ncbi:MAG: fructosamine kinase family protein [Saprospiraceae bacterium]|nr:fructosamine kinase family protein [Saprospiraceae bacterium]MCB9319189.1 fructosamine kinase family protein [Lewinellaceae bacterium]
MIIPGEVLTLLGLNHLQPTVLSGGSIHQVYLLQNDSEAFVLKLSTEKQGKSMLEAEVDGLQIIQSSGSIRVPEVYRQGESGQCSYILMEYIPSTRHLDRPFGIRFGQRLAELHRNSADLYGYSRSNFIGSLPQTNDYQATWVEFYIAERLQPQWKKACDSGFFTASDQRQFDQFLKMLVARLPEEHPSLLHGDLWSGNYLASISGEPVLIDPAVYYGHREVDLAMSLLFGGFPDSFYHSYRETYPLEHGWEERVPDYQLYYLLVHVNLFGGSYVSSCLEVINRY